MLQAHAAMARRVDGAGEYAGDGLPTLLPGNAWTPCLCQLQCARRCAGRDKGVATQPEARQNGNMPRETDCLPSAHSTRRTSPLAMILGGQAVELGGGLFGCWRVVGQIKNPQLLSLDSEDQNELSIGSALYSGLFCPNSLHRIVTTIRYSPLLPAHTPPRSGITAAAQVDLDAHRPPAPAAPTSAYDQARVGDGPGQYEYEYVGGKLPTKDYCIKDYS